MPAQTPALLKFENSIAKSFRPDVLESFWACEPAFVELLASKAAQAEINAGLIAISRNPDESAAGASGELVLQTGGGTALVVSLAEAPKRYLHVIPYHALYATLGQEEIAFDRYKAPEGYRNDLFDANLRLEAPIRGKLQPGQALRLACGDAAFDFHFEKPTLLLKFVTTALLPLEWLFSRDTLQAWQANDADLSFTQLRVAADVLGKVAHQSSIPPLKMMSHHGHHAVRWAAITNLGRINRSEAIARLREALEDPHPHVRNAAAKTLQKLEPR